MAPPEISSLLRNAAIHRVLRDYATALAREHADLMDALQAGANARASVPPGDLLLAELSKSPDSWSQRRTELRTLAEHFHVARASIKVTEPVRNAEAWFLEVECAFDIPRRFRIDELPDSEAEAATIADRLEDI